MGLRRMTSNLFTRSNMHKPNNTLVSAQFEHFWCQDKPHATSNSQDSPQPGLGGSHHLPPYSIICTFPWGHIQMAFCPGTLKWESQNFQNQDFYNFGAHNFACRPPIVMKFKTNLQPSSRAFQRYVAHLLHVRKSDRFLTFNARESNYQFDFWPFFLS